MPRLNEEAIAKYVTENIPDFHKTKLQRLEELKLLGVLKRKNPYLLKAKGLTTPRELVKAILDAFLSSAEETLLGTFLEGLAVFTAREVWGAHGKSGTPGIDLELEKDGMRYFVAIKSGPAWGNSSQIKKMRADFRTATMVYRQNANALPVECVNGCCYGKQQRKREHKGDYVKLCGQRFWEFISRDEDFYLKIVEPIGLNAKERNEEFLAHYELVLDKFTDVFREHYCDANNVIQWDKLTMASSKAP